MTGIAVGAAAAGLRTVHVHIRMDFVLLCMNQLINMAAKMRYMYNGAVKIPMVVRCMVGRSWGQVRNTHSLSIHYLLIYLD